MPFTYLGALTQTMSCCVLAQVLEVLFDILASYRRMADWHTARLKQQQEDLAELLALQEAAQGSPVALPNGGEYGKGVGPGILSGVLPYLRVERVYQKPRRLSRMHVKKSLKDF